VTKRAYFALLPALVLAGGAAHAQYPLLDKVASKVIQKYQQSSCQQLWQQKGQPKTEEEKRAINFLRSDPQMRTIFINKVAGPIVNKMFECGMIP
jgi:ABC-type Fe2+-enterobactin transport system substrate-binding protein